MFQQARIIRNSSCYSTQLPLASHPVIGMRKIHTHWELESRTTARHAGKIYSHSLSIILGLYFVYYITIFNYHL